MKILKRILKVLLWTVAVVLAALLLHPLWAGPIAKWCANSMVPGMTKTEFHVEKISLNLYSGNLEVEGCRLGNPSNYLTRTAFELERLHVGFDTLSALSDTILIRDIEIKGATVACVLEGMTRMDPHLNFIDIANAVKEGKQPEPEKEGPGKRVAIDKISINGCYAEIGFDGAVVPIPIPSFEISDIGKNADEGKSKDGSSGGSGLTVEEAWNTVWEALEKAEPALAAAWNTIATAVEFLLDGAGGIAGKVGDAGAAAADAVGGLAKDAWSAGEDAAKKAGKFLGL